MIKNIGKTDMVVRLVLGIIFVLFFTFWLKVVGVILLVTALVGYCPLYSLFKNKSKVVAEKKVAKKGKKK